MSPMYRYFFLKKQFLFYILIAICLCSNAPAQTNDDMNIFLMYYEEKDLVVSSTRNLKPISQAAENITVIHKETIEEMNAHSVAEILNRVTGLFIYSYTMDFGSPSLVEIQGSYARHVLVLLDGFPWNSLAGQFAETLSIPVEIIERIEIIKGPASSAWGSSLGGVINIITKYAGNSEKPKGSVTASFGGKSRQDYRTDVTGTAGIANYYVYAGRQQSDPLLTLEPYTNSSAYSKISLPFSDYVNLDLSAGISKPGFGLGNPLPLMRTMLFGKSSYNDPFLELLEFMYPAMTSKGNIDTCFITSNLEIYISKNLFAGISLNQFCHQLEIPVWSFQDTELLTNLSFDEKSTRGSCKLVWNKNKHTAVIGMDSDFGELNQVAVFEDMPEFNSNQKIKKWAIYTNDTIVIDRLSIIPGIRFDYNNLGGSFTSPSLGLTYRFSESSIVRTSVARGFNAPPIKGNGLIFNANQSVEPEDVWAFQVSLEKRMFKYAWAKTTLFKYNLNNSLKFSMENTAQGYMIINQPGTSCHGFEIEAQTVPVYHLSLHGGMSYIKRDNIEIKDATEKNIYNIDLKYDNQKNFNARLTGHYLIGTLIFKPSEGNDVIWDVIINRTFFTSRRLSGKFFLSAHNIFNGFRSTLSDTSNPNRWIEAGIKIRF